MPKDSSQELEGRKSRARTNFYFLFNIKGINKMFRSFRLSFRRPTRRRRRWMKMKSSLKHIKTNLWRILTTFSMLVSNTINNFKR